MNMLYHYWCHYLLASANKTCRYYCTLVVSKSGPNKLYAQRQDVIWKDRKMTVHLMQWTSDQLQYWLRNRSCAVCDFRRVDSTNKLTRRTSITKLFCEWRRERVNSLTPESVLAGTKNSRSEGFWLVKHKHSNIPTMMEPFPPPAIWFWWIKIPHPQEPLRKGLDKAAVKGF